METYFKSGQVYLTEILLYEIENLQLQINTQKKWFWIAIVTAVIVEVVRIYFSWR